MGALVTSAFRAVGSLLTPGMIWVFIFSVLVSIAVLAGFVVVVAVAFNWAAGTYGLATYMPWLFDFGALMAAWMLFPAVTPVIVSFFDMRITRIIEQHDYPGAAQPLPARFWPEFWHDVGFTLNTVVMNIIVLPLYLVPGVNVILFYVLNGHLLGREYFVMAARRHMPVAQAVALRRQHGRAVFCGGILLTLMATIPVVNLFAPFWGVAVMVHLYHQVQKTPKAQIISPERR